MPILGRPPDDPMESIGGMDVLVTVEVANDRALKVSESKDDVDDEAKIWLMPERSKEALEVVVKDAREKRVPGVLVPTPTLVLVSSYTKFVAPPKAEELLY